MIDNDPIFDFYKLSKKKFEGFFQTYKKEMESILAKHIKLYLSALKKDESMLNTLSISLLVNITEISTSETGIGGLHDSLRLGIRELARDFDANEFTKGTNLSQFSEHWKNVGHYCFMVVYVTVLKKKNGKIKNDE